MAKGIFTTKVRPTYDDLPEVRYHFPRTYLNQARQMVGDWVIYYEPRRQDADPSGREGRQAYFGVARVQSIETDARIPEHYYAHVTEYLEFDHPVPFREADHYYESALRKDDGSTNRGAFGRAVRNIPDHEFEAILTAGFASLLNADMVSADALRVPGLVEEYVPFERKIEERLTRRPFRDAAFAKLVRTAYDATCALTGLRLINGGGRCEVEAAHIRPIGDGHGGPDSVRNGIALSQTMHWMFDRGLVSLTDDFEILVVRQALPERVRSLFNSDGRIGLPANSTYRPHPQFLAYHRAFWTEKGKEYSKLSGC